LLTIRRPNRLAFRVSGDVDLRGWYDGEKVTFVLIGTRSTGGYVNRETVDDVACHHVTYSHPAVGWELWIPEEADPRPKKFVVTNKTTAPASTAEVTFDKWTYGVDTPDATFAPEVPAGYGRVQIVVGAPETSPASPTGAPQQ
jgi:hypothetical protein